MHLLPDGKNASIAYAAALGCCCLALCKIQDMLQVLVDCVNANGTNGCNGGNPTAAYSYILEHGIPDETCSNYEVYPQQQRLLCLLCDLQTEMDNV